MPNKNSDKKGSISCVETNYLSKNATIGNSSSRFLGSTSSFISMEPMNSNGMNYSDFQEENLTFLDIPRNRVPFQTYHDTDISKAHLTRANNSFSFNESKIISQNKVSTSNNDDFVYKRRDIPKHLYLPLL